MEFPGKLAVQVGFAIGASLISGAGRVRVPLEPHVWAMGEVRFR
jgi:hypothetical protein